tara:strand:+ start:174 stop:365 length:192 start_codon:yes stop_codon:yes gene_type:complete
MCEITTVLNYIDELRSWLEGDANCPCCDKNDVCVKSCSFSEDRPHDFDKMEEVRNLLRKTSGQ